MASRLDIREGVITRHDRIDPAEGNRARRYLRDMATGGRKSAKPVHEMFVWTQEEDRLLRKIRPDLFEGSARDRQKALRRFARTSEGKAFLCR